MSPPPAGIMWMPAVGNSRDLKSTACLFSFPTQRNIQTDRGAAARASRSPQTGGPFEVWTPKKLHLNVIPAVVGNPDVYQLYYIKNCADKIINKLKYMFLSFRELNKNLRDESDMCFQVCAIEGNAQMC